MKKEGNYLMLMHWWILQKVSKMKRRAFSMKSSRQATRKKSFTKTWKCKVFSIKPSKRQKKFCKTSQSQGSSKAKGWQSTVSNWWSRVQLYIFKMIGIQRGKTTVSPEKARIKKDRTAKIYATRNFIFLSSLYGVWVIPGCERCFNETTNLQIQRTQHETTQRTLRRPPRTPHCLRLINSHLVWCQLLSAGAPSF